MNISFLKHNPATSSMDQDPATYSSPTAQSHGSTSKATTTISNKPSYRIAATKIRASKILIATGTFALLSACGGGGDNSAAVSQLPPAFSGTISTPRGIAEPIIELRSPEGELKEVPVDELGQFSLDDIQIGARYLMRANLGNNNFLYSIAHLSEVTANRQNIHSYTDLVARTWFADQGLNINSVFTSAASIENFPSSETISGIDANIQAIVSDALEVYGLTDVSLSSAAYAAIDTGIDRFLNENPVIIRNNRATIIVNDPQTNLQAVAVNRVALQTTFGEIDTIPPQQAQNVRALSAGSADDNGVIVLAWTTATDNIGVATYEIYRDEVLIDHTPLPLYRDTTVTQNTDYTYTVVTVDESGNRSTPSFAVTGRSLLTPDTTIPATPSSSTLNANTESAEVFWSHSNLFDVARFEVTRTGGDGILVREVTSPDLSDITVASGTEYCYSIVAVDASSNRSEPNPTACITTSGSAVALQETINIPATVEMAQESVAGSEGTTISAFVNRLGDASGEISIDYVFNPGTASAEEDYIASDGTLVWTDGDITARQIEIQLQTDGITEGSETLSVVLTNTSSNAVIANPTTSITIIDID